MTAVGVIGLGSMGGGVAKSLLAKKFETHVYDVRAEVVKAFAAQGAKAAAHQLYLAAAAQGHGLEDDASVVKVYAALAGLELPTK
jgi:3-hydroxyisobutyrate dehydrogenase-like beta-hydroxyacid dehydrogenase